MARAENRQTELPVKAPKTERRKERKTVFVLLCGDRAAVCRRPAEGLLAGMWELPMADGWLSEAEQQTKLSVWGIEPSGVLRQLPDAKHIFTHIEWQMHGVLVHVPVQTGEFRWISPQERAEKIALPSAFRAFVRYLP